MHTQTIAAKGLPFSKVSVNIKLTLNDALIWLTMTYTCPTWEIAAGTCLIKSECLQNKGLHTTAIFPRCTQNLYVAFNIPYIYVFITLPYKCGVCKYYFATYGYLEQYLEDKVHFCKSCNTQCSYLGSRVAVKL
jgi:hypothetical protein